MSNSLFKSFDMVPKGRLIMIRNTDNPVPEKDKETNGSFFLHEIFQILSSSKDASIELITTASDQEKQVEKKYAEGLIAAGYRNFNFLYLNK
jgi:hypothetical protein